MRSERRRLGPNLSTRLDVADTEVVEALAAADGVTVSSWLRAAACREIRDRRPDHHPRPVRTRPRSRPTPDVAAISTLVGVLHRVGGELTRTAAVVRVRGDVDVHTELEATLAAVRDAADAVRAMTTRVHVA